MNEDKKYPAHEICITCGSTKKNAETACCINGHDDWLEDIDDVHIFYHATIKLGVSLKTIMDAFDNNTDIIKKDIMSNKKTKIKNNAIRYKLALDKEIQDNPDYCFCQELLGLEPDVDFENDKEIGKTDPIDGFSYWNSIGYTLPIYICKRCGKKVTLSTVY